MKCEIISFKTIDGLELFGALQENKKSHTAIIHVHGMTDHFFESNTMTVMSEVAQKFNFQFLTFNNRGAEVISTINHEFYGTALEHFEDCVYDIDAAVNFLKKKGVKKIILSGHSTGCQKIAYYWAKKRPENITALIFLAPADDMNFQKKMLGKIFPYSIKFAQKMMKHEKSEMPMPLKFGAPYFSAHRYYSLYSGKSTEGNIFNYEENLDLIKKIKIPFLAVFGRDEQYAAISPKKMLKKIAKFRQNRKSQTVLINGADHSFHRQEADLSKEIRKFFTSL